MSGSGKKLENLTTITDKWIYFVKHAGEMDFIPKDMDSEFKKAFEIINESALSEEELEAQHRRHDFIYLQKSSISKAERIGREEGREEGSSMRNKENALKMKVKGYPLIDITGLTEEEIENL